MPNVVACVTSCGWTPEGRVFVQGQASVPGGPPQIFEATYTFGASTPQKRLTVEAAAKLALTDSPQAIVFEVTDAVDLWGGLT